jgi:hypothetical protein
MSTWAAAGSPMPSWIASFTPRTASKSLPKTPCENHGPACPMPDSLISNHSAYVASLRCCPPSPDQLSIMTGMRNTKRPYQLDRVASSRNNWTSLKSCSRFFSINIICDPAPTTTIRFKGAFDRALKTPNASASVNT